VQLLALLLLVVVGLLPMPLLLLQASITRFTPVT
jgi:hypothetical protein